MTKKLIYQPITFKNQAAVNELIIEAFNEDTRRHGQGVAGGPPGYDDGQLLARLQVEVGELESVYYQECLIGCVCTQPLSQSGQGELRLLCIALAHQNQGFGQQIWQDLEVRNHYQKWRVETPDYSLNNQRFYEEKCGFQRVAIHDYDGSQAFIFEKNLGRKVVEL